MGEVVSKSERDGLAALLDSDMEVLSIGISTGGEAEIKMAKYDPRRRITATTLDPEGAEQVRAKISQLGLDDRVTVSVEDVAAVEPAHKDESFDYIYARLVLHYLNAQQLEVAVANLYRMLKQGGRLFVVVRSVRCEEARRPDNVFDPQTQMTTYLSALGQQESRYFHTQESISGVLERHGFTIDAITQFDEQLSPSFNRDDGVWVANDLIELIAEK